MPEVEIINLTKKYKSQKGEKITALNDVNLKIEDKHYNTLLGPSGCGKTTLLRIVAGLIKPTRGKILFDNKDVTDVLPEERNIGFVFQDFAVFPHLDVWHNVSYGPTVKGWPKEKIKKATNAIFSNATECQAIKPIITVKLLKQRKR
ncbi:ATP-binding cassette domain-containing protein [Patescibacteria group bacterium]|nr:ATP-binding cassette domain-containing protein [Patescibacteria group bacterium]MBU4455508.1 ATP-binding cassette domain-containing protein [Patescibacteria group bacterium]